MTVGRKMSALTCRRAICCRVERKKKKNTAKTNLSAATIPPNTDDEKDEVYRLHHPAIMGTAVYMDETGTIDVSDSTPHGQDVRFHSPLSFVSWLQPTNDEADSHVVECIDGSTGYLADATPPLPSLPTRSRVSTAALVELFLEILDSAEGATPLNCSAHSKIPTTARPLPTTLSEMRALKRKVAPTYEAAKEEMLSKHPVMRHWRRRQKDIDASY
jgi:hypothetical protein